MDNKEFKPFRHTFTWISLIMSVGLIYPNPKTDVKRILILLAVMVTGIPLTYITLNEMYHGWMEGDIITVIRHSTVIGPFVGGFFKIMLIFMKRKESKQILDEMDNDYESYNYMSEEYKQINRAGVRNSVVYSERCWVLLVAACVTTFPMMAIVQNVYEYFFVVDPSRYMLHDMKIPFCDPDLRFASPYYEIVFAYQLYCSVWFVINFTGFDGFFGVCINHTCMKIEIFSKLLEDAMLSEPGKVRENVVNVIREQNKLFDYIELIQEAFNNWLGLIFLATVIQLCTCLYHITEGYGFDLRYMIFLCACVAHVYLPCRYAGKMKAMSLETSTKFYCCGWENVNDIMIRRMITFMIARGQRPIVITAFNILAFDMELFLSIMQSSYSMFTLLRS